MKYFSKSGVGIHTDYRENIIKDKDHPILKWKATKKNERLPDGAPYIASQHSEDALSWNVFVSLHQAGKLSLITDMLPVHESVKELYFWQHALSQRSQEVDREIQDVLNEMEPWGKDGVRQQTETDVILRGTHHIIMVESKLGKPSERVRVWSRSRPGMRPQYRPFIDQLEAAGVKLFNDAFDYKRDGNRFYQLFRNYLLGAALSLKWNAKFSLLAIVNCLNSNLEGRSHEEEFQTFRCLLEESGNTFLMTWQQLWRILPDEPKLSQLRRWLQGHPLLCLS